MPPTASILRIEVSHGRETDQGDGDIILRCYFVGDALALPREKTQGPDKGVFQ